MPASLALAAAVSFAVVGDGIPAPLTGTPGDAVAGRAIVVDRTVGLCLLCHGGPFDRTSIERAQGNLSTDLAGAGRRWSAAQLRLRVADARHLNPDSLMPAFHRAAPDADRQRVGAAWRGQPVLSAQQVEDVVAFLVTLK
ncbi:MAG: sulfur oxidation c-type cytochrome SoxX [Leptothrix sp. (in: Bacteria)]|nr:sulfur oxidation c-type cytochrome SoxX [Leptothrix sp. (in: b-proteobacteria)]